MYSVKIFGAGSVGNHLAFAARSMGWSVAVSDVDDRALQRMKNEIYPQRYGKWDDTIRLYNNRHVPKGEYDLIFVGTPPDSHLPLAREALEEKPRAILIEKPLCTPSLEFAQDFYQECLRSSAQVFVGYDHVVSLATQLVEELLSQGVIGEIETIDVEFREHWGGIFAAHPWLNGPEDSYLGFWQRGGGASGEHSHAMNLWQHFAHVAGRGRVVEVESMIKYVTHGKASYDSLCLLRLRSEGGLVGRVVQDVVMVPSRKRARIQGTKGSIEWVYGYDTQGDAVIIHRPGSPEEVRFIKKTRADDFIQEMKVIHSQVMDESRGWCSIALDRGLDTMLVLAAAHRSEHEKRRMVIEYDLGYGQHAIRPA